MSEAKLLQAADRYGLKKLGHYLEAKVRSYQGHHDKAVLSYLAMLQDKAGGDNPSLALSGLYQSQCYQGSKSELSPEAYAAMLAAANDLVATNGDSIIANRILLQHAKTNKNWSEARLRQQKLNELTRPKRFVGAGKDREGWRKSQAIELSKLLTLEAKALGSDQANKASYRQLLEQALQEWPNNEEATLSLAQFLADAGETKAARRQLCDLWRNHPSPAIAKLYRQIHDSPSSKESEAALMARLQILAGHNPAHAETHYMLLEQAINAKIMGDARQHIQALMPKDMVLSFPLAAPAADMKQEITARQALALAEFANAEGQQHIALGWYQYGLNQALGGNHAL